MAEKRVPPEIQQLIIQYQSMREHYARIDAELKVVEAELADIDNITATLKEVSDDAELYKAVGHVLVKRGKADILKELDERRELLTIKRDKYRKQLEFLSKQISELEARIREALQRSGIGIGQ